jgi:hypothetical protein
MTAYLERFATELAWRNSRHLSTFADALNRFDQEFVVRRQKRHVRGENRRLREEQALALASKNSVK